MPAEASVEASGTGSVDVDSGEVLTSMVTAAPVSSAVFFFRPRFGGAAGGVTPSSAWTMLPDSAVSVAFASAFLRVRVFLSVARERDGVRRKKEEFR